MHRVKRYHRSLHLCSFPCGLVSIEDGNIVRLRKYEELHVRYKFMYIKVNFCNGAMPPKK